MPDVNIGRVSIGLPVYNGARYLPETLDSLLAQTYEDFELIISDNGSTDDTEAVCRAYQAKDPRIRYYRNRVNRGAAYNFGRVFELATTKYFKWANADDVCGPEHIARCASVLAAHPDVVLAYPKTRFIDENGRALDIHDPGWDLRSDVAAERVRYVFAARHWVNSIYGLIRAEALAQTRLIATYPGGDYRVLGELAFVGKMVEIQDYFFLRRLHPTAASQNQTLAWQIVHYTGRADRLTLPVCQRTHDDFTMVLRSRLRGAVKLSLCGSLLARLIHERDTVAAELRMAAAYGIRRLRPRLVSPTV